MGSYRHLALGLSVGLVLAGCAPQDKPTVVAAQAHPSKPAQPSAVSDPKTVERLSASVAALDADAFRAVSMAQVGGAVVLTGAVVRPDQRRLLEQRVWSIPGVAAVSNRVQIVDGAALDGYLPDRNKEKDVADRLAPGLAARVVKGVVYLVGVASPDDVGRLKEALADDPAIQWVDATAVAAR